MPEIKKKMFTYIFVFFSVCKQMTTYDYIIQNRNNTAASKTSLPSDVEAAGEPAPPPMRALSVFYSFCIKDMKQSFIYFMIHTYDYD